MRLIDADALMRKFKTASPMAIDGRARQIVDDMPTIEERKTGKWIKAKKSLWSAGTCSVCGAISVEADTANYCKNCGAKMKGEDDGLD